MALRTVLIHGNDVCMHLCHSYKDFNLSKVEYVYRNTIEFEKQTRLFICFQTIGMDAFDFL